MTDERSGSERAEEEEALAGIRAATALVEQIEQAQALIPVLRRTAFIRRYGLEED